MSNLFIIGNGFDLSHNLKTSYEDFHTYLKKEYPSATPNDCVPEYVVDGHGEEVPTNEDEVIGFIEHLLCDVDGDKWSNLESSIGEIDFENYLLDYEHDEQDDDDLWDEMYYNEDGAMSLVNPILEIPSYFSRWILTINLNDAKFMLDFSHIINKNNDLFLSFNYTKTLEYLYGIKHVCHIHGMQGEKLLFGHGKDYDYFSDDNYGMLPGTEDSFQKIHDALKKDTKRALKENKSFFEMLKSSIDKIYSYGFSFSEVDEIYIREICNILDTKTITWYLNDFDDESVRDNYQGIIIKCGFRGSFCTYTINE